MTVAWLPDVERRPRRVAIGTFDGVHRGHREVIRGADTVLTFDPHPSTVVHPQAVPKLLTTPDRKAQLIEGLGVDEVVVIPFDGDFAARSAQDFIDGVLIDALGATHVSVGENFRFGNRAKGSTDMLAADDRFETRVVELLEVDGEVVSSSHIRGLLLGGAVEYAGTLLGEPYVLSGEVVHGDKRGRDLGYPTANIVPIDSYATPGHGVYACVATGGVPAAVSIGVRPTFETGRGELVEAFLIDWEGDLYGKTLDLAFVKRLRGEKRFDSVEALVAQMERDVDAARRLVAERNAA